MAKRRRNPEAKRHGKSNRQRKGRSIFYEVLDDLADQLFDSFPFDSDPLPFENYEPPSIPQPVSPLTAEENQLYIEIVDLGFKEAAKRYHPDREGGDPEKMAFINALRDKVRRLSGIGK